MDKYMYRLHGKMCYGLGIATLAHAMIQTIYFGVAIGIALMACGIYLEERGRT